MRWLLFFLNILDLTEPELVGHCLALVMAETTTSILSFTFYELARNPHCQQLAYEEIIQVLDESDNQFSYEALLKMNYLNSVLLGILDRNIYLCI